MIQIFRDLVWVEYGFLNHDADPFWFNLGGGIVLALITASVIFGGVKRIAQVAITLVPSMSALYVGAALFALALNFEDIPDAMRLIFIDAFSAEAAAGGSLLTMILYGVRAGSFQQ